MSTRDDHDPLGALRRQAEYVLGEQPGPPDEGALPPDPQALIAELRRQGHELHVHQIELQLQMEQLMTTNVELEQARAEYGELFDFAPVGYLTLDRTGQILRANLTAAHQLGVERGALTRKRLSTFVDPAHASSLALFLRRVFDSPRRRTLELRLRAAGGTSFHAQIECLAAEDGTHARAAVMDITAQREAQDEVLRLNATLEERVEQRTTHIQQLGEELETFVHSVTHDLLMPLQHIRAFTARLVQARLPEDDEQARYARHVVHSVERMEELLSALTAFFRVSRQRVRFLEVDLNRALKEVLKDLRGELEGRDVRLTSDPLPTVVGDSGALQLVLTHLLGNALKFTRGREEARIHVGAQETPREYVVSVEDNGVGFNMRQKGRLFGMFQRLHAERDFGGAGVGLALVRRVVLRHSGRVWAEGKPGQGATFWFSLPKQPPQLEDAAPARRVPVDR